MRYIGENNINPIQIAFMRFFISMLSVLPFMLPKGIFYFKMHSPKLHFWRAFYGCLAIFLCTISVLKFQLFCNTSIMFAEPILFLPLAAIFLKEKIDAGRWISVIIGLLGIIIILNKEILNLNMWFFIPLLSAFFFAVTTMIAKKMTFEDHIYTLLFYFGLMSTLFTLIPAILVWKPLTFQQICLFTFLGINENIVQVFMFKAFSMSEASPLMPLRYTEAVFSCLAGYLFFGQIPFIHTIIGCIILILCSASITIIEKRKEKSIGC